MKPCPHFLKRFAVLAAASLILSAVTLSASAAAAPVSMKKSVPLLPLSMAHRKRKIWL